jgi:hypothetical protein
MRKVILLLFLSISFLGFSQEVKLKKGDVLIDGLPWIKYQDCGTFDSTCSLLNNQKEEIVFFKTISIDGAEPITQYNKTGTLSYYEVIFVGQKMKIELQKRQKDIIEILYNGKVINEDGTLNPEKLDRLVEKYGTPFSDRLNRSNNNPNTIIINNNQEPQRSGVNINIGR